jgi:hypothetical protein
MQEHYRFACLKPAKFQVDFSKPEKPNDEKTMHELCRFCRFIFIRSDQKHTDFPLDGTKE